MFRGFFTALLLLVTTNVGAQYAVSHSPAIYSPYITVNEEPDAPPVIVLGGDDVLHFSFDEMSHAYKRYLCRVTHFNADYSQSELSEIEYLEGFNDFPVEQWENSVNTTKLYTHYEFDVPNENISLKVSGNYRVEVYDDEASEDSPVVSFDFAVVEPLVSVNAWVSGDTDRSLNTTEQQLSFVVNASRCNVASPANEILPVVMQNRRRTSTVRGLCPTYIMGDELQYVHNEKLIFPSGNEYRRFELTDPRIPGMGVEEVFYTPEGYHALLFIDKPRLSHSNYRDENGRYYINTLEGRGSLIEADYVYAHFALSVPYRKGGNYYLQGDFCNSLSSDNILEYDSEGSFYFVSKLLKLGLYNYNYVWVPENNAMLQPGGVEGDFYDTENEYIIYIYHRAFGARYDRLVGVHTATYRLENN